MRPAIFFSRLPDAAMEHPNRRLAPPDRNGVDTTETTISSTISTNSSSSSAAAAVPFTISSIPGHSHLTPNQRYHGHQDHPASSQHGRPTSMLLPHSTSLRSSRRTNLPVRQRPRISRDVRPSDPQAGLLQLFQGRSYLYFDIFNSAVSYAALSSVGCLQSDRGSRRSLHRANKAMVVSVPPRVPSQQCQLLPARSSQPMQWLWRRALSRVLPSQAYCS